MDDTGKEKKLFGKARAAASRVKEISDEKLANLIEKAVGKQEGVNRILQQRGADYRVGSVDIEMGLPPRIVFGVERIADLNAEPD